MSTGAENHSNKITAAPPQIPGLRPARRILLVEDETFLLRLCAEVLVESGYQVDTAANGADAWRTLEKNPEKPYDLLITDNNMPWVTGMELIKKVRSEHMMLPVILASGTVPTEEIERNEWMQIDAVLAKPFTIDGFLETVTEVLNAADKMAGSAKLFRECAMQDKQISLAENPADAPIQERLSLSYRILVVDDDSQTRQNSVTVLTGSGYDVEGAKDGAAGWEALQNDDYDLVVTDNKMPNMTGMEMIAKLRTARMAVPVIMATGIPPTNLIERNAWLKPDAILQRPFSDEDLLNTIKSVLHPDAGNGAPGGGKGETPLPNDL
jgi:DNA-binding response OmpR family regulator